MRISDSDRARRSPAKILGSAEGRTISEIRCRAATAGTPAAVSRCSGSTERAPSAVLSSTGQTTLKAIEASCMREPNSNTTMKTVTRAGGGIARSELQDAVEIGVGLGRQAQREPEHDAEDRPAREAARHPAQAGQDVLDGQVGEEEPLRRAGEPHRVHPGHDGGRWREEHAAGDRGPPLPRRHQQDQQQPAGGERPGEAAHDRAHRPAPTATGAPACAPSLACCQAKSRRSAATSSALITTPNSPTQTTPAMMSSILAGTAMPAK